MFSILVEKSGVDISCSVFADFVCKIAFSFLLFTFLNYTRSEVLLVTSIGILRSFFSFFDLGKFMSTIASNIFNDL